MKALAKDLNVPNKWTTALFVIYLIALVWILLLKLGVEFSYMENRNTNFSPFNEPIFLTAENMLKALIFVPPGIYAGVLFSRPDISKGNLFSPFRINPKPEIFLNVRPP
ncbi:hypothetical protein [Cyclobacterium sp.]|uniref:hypothetical protein n=1 Tax=Cyclobacterium sp. TaxID=1966343 RepID=UPI001998D7EE|nr:hypothetical protein [Cyclobacterium sp.]MBD3631151.1 hypothetical protein [Cyclobacterium sp.]